MKKLFLVFLICTSITPLYAQKQIQCPSNGILRIDPETNETICCKDGYAYEWNDKKNTFEEYTFPELCGCPDGGRIIDGYCCRNHLKLGMQRFDSKATYAFADPVCGCPKGGHEEKGRCCLNGKGWNKNKQNYTSIEAECGCPDGGYAAFLDSGQYACCKKGYYLTKNGYTEWDWWGTCECQGNILCYLHQFIDRLKRRIKGENECCA